MKKRMGFAALVSCLCILAWGLLELFNWRYANGDVFPPYSSLRADPLGTMAFYEGLGEIPGLTVQRNFSTENSLPDGHDTTCMWFAGDLQDWVWLSNAEASKLQRFLAAGGRLVILGFPRTQVSNLDGQKGGFSSAGSASETHVVAHSVQDGVDDYQSSGGGDQMGAWPSGLWGVHLDFRPLANDDKGYLPAMVRLHAGLALPVQLPWPGRG